MASFTIRLNTLKEIEDFTILASTIPDEVYVKSIHNILYSVNGKSIMGIVSLGHQILSEGVIVEVSKYEYLSAFNRLSH
jgi:hypothetical protein